jgi:chromosome segregation ATPase
MAAASASQQAAIEAERDAALRNAADTANRLAELNKRYQTEVDALAAERERVLKEAETGHNELGMQVQDRETRAAQAQRELSRVLEERKEDQRRIRELHHQMQQQQQASDEESRRHKELTEEERSKTREAIVRIEEERNSLAQRLREQDSSHHNHLGEVERLKSVVKQKESEIADIDRLLNEYRLQIRTLADRCTSLESAAADKANIAQSANSHSRRRKPMNATKWNFADTGAPSTATPDHPLAELEAKAARELLSWRTSKNGAQTKPG